MKLIVVFLTVVLLQTAGKSFGQTVTLTMKDAPMEKVFKAIEKQTGYFFTYVKDQLQGTNNVNIDVKNVSIQEALDICFKNQPVTFDIIEKSIIVKKNTEKTKPTEQKTASPTIDIKGRVVNERNELVVGASVKVKGSSQMTSSNENGEFELKGIDAKAKLVVSSINIEDKELNLNGETSLIIATKVKITQMEDVKVLANTGYQQLKLNEVTGSIAHLNNEQINRTFSTDILERLKGTSGLLLMTGSREDIVDQRSNIQVRSTSSINASRYPLIVIDNFPYEGDITNINPNDVESIDILKDAASASQWGVRGANGVIVITTKKGNYNRRTKVSFTTNISTTQKPDLFYSNTLNSSDYIDVETFLFKQGYYDPDILSIYRPRLSPVVEILLKRKNGQIAAADSAVEIDELRGFDVRHDMTKYYLSSPLKQQYSLNLTGGSSNQQFFLSVGYDNSINSLNIYKRTTINAANTYSLLNRRMEVSTGIALVNNLTNILTSNYGFSYPYERLVDEQGNPLLFSQYRQGYTDTAGAGRLLDWRFSPLQEKEYANNKQTGFSYRLNIAAKYKIINGLVISIKYQYAKERKELKNLQSLNSYYTRDYINQFSSINWATGIVTRRVPLGAILDVSNIIYTAQNIRGQLDYSKSWGHKHQLSAIVGVESGEGVTNNNTYRVYGYDEENATSSPVDFVNTYTNYITQLTSSIIANNQSFSEANDRSISTYINTAYVYKEKYTLTASARRDGANIFGTNTNNKWSPLWSSGISWNIAKELFYKIKWLPMLKLRLSYGSQGNIGRSVSALLTVLSINGPNIWRLPYTQIRNPPNPDLRWEKTKTINFGIDYSILNGRISGSFEYYQRKGSDLLARAFLAPSLGRTSYLGNTADMKGQGIDVIVNLNHETGKIKWLTNLNFSYAKDKVTNYKSSLGNISGYVTDLSSINPIIGNPVSSIYAFRWAGLDPTSGDPLGYINGQISKDYPTLINSANLTDMKYIGPSVAPYYGSILNTINWRGLSVSFNIIYKLGYYFRKESINYYNLFTRLDGGSQDYLSRWQKPGDEKITNIPSLVYPADNERDIFYSFSEVIFKKADHIRWQDVRISYNINRQKAKKLPFESATAYTSVSNLGILWRANKENIDPDYYQTNRYGNGLPRKSIAVGIKVEF